MKSAICPKCFASLAEEKWVYSCHQNSCKQKDMPILAELAAKGRGGLPVCPECSEPYASALCPLCGFPIHDVEVGDSALSVSLVGAEGCGKSHYLSVLVEELKTNVAKACDYSLFPVGGDDTLLLYDHQYYQPLFVQGHILPKTDQDEINPLIYSLVFQQERAVKTLDLTLYDACGANFESITAMANFNRSVYHSGGIIFIIEPSQLPSVSEWRKSHGMPVCEADAVSLLSRTIQLVRTGLGQKNLRQKLDVPIAICISKLDTIKQLMDAGSYLRAPSRHLRDAAFDSIDFNACSLEAQSMIEAWGGGEIVRHVTSQFNDFAFFGFSSLGDSPTKSGGVSHIAPHRVADPLLWLLWKSKAIK